MAPLTWDKDVIHIAKSNGDGTVKHYQHIRIHKAETNYETKETKTAGSERIVVIAGKPAEGIEALRKPGKRVFLGMQGQEVQPVRLTQNYKLLCKRHSIRYVTPKNLRTTYGTLRQTHGGDPTITSKSMGHTNLNVDYDHYFVTQLEAFEREADIMGEAIGDMLLRDVAR